MPGFQLGDIYETTSNNESENNEDEESTRESYETDLYEKYEELHNIIKDEIKKSKCCKFCEFLKEVKISWGEYEVYCAIFKEELKDLDKRCKMCIETFGKD